MTTASALDLTRDEILTCTAGVVFISEQHVNTRGDIIMHVDVKAQIDPEEAALAVIALRQNDDARQPLQLLRTEVDDLHQQLEQMTAQLAAATSPEQLLSASQQRQDMLNRVQSDHVLTQAWTDWPLVSPAAYPTSMDRRRSSAKVCGHKPLGSIRATHISPCYSACCMDRHLHMLFLRFLRRR